MKETPVKLPGPDHPISIQRNPARVVVSVAGHVVADTGDALTLREAAYPPVQYIPAEDVDFSQLERTDYVTWCPYKGECSYYSVPAGGKKSINAVWSYENPFPAVAQIRGHVAFYPERVDEIAEKLPTQNRTALSYVRGNSMSPTKQEKNKALVLEAFDTLFNQRDYAAAERYWSPGYIQHSAHIEPGREGLFKLVKSLPATLRYESGLVVAEGDFVIAHGRFSGFGAMVNWIAADIVRIQDGILVEHWDVIENEVTEQESKSKAPMFGDTFPT